MINWEANELTNCVQRIAFYAVGCTRKVLLAENLAGTPPHRTGVELCRPPPDLSRDVPIDMSPMI